MFHQFPLEQEMQVIVLGERVPNNEIDNSENSLKYIFLRFQVFEKMLFFGFFHRFCFFSVL